MRPAEPVEGSAPADRAAASGRRPLLRLLLLAGLVGLVAVLAGVVGLPDAAGVRAAVDDLGAAAPAAFVLLYAAATLAPLPKNVLTVAAGLLFGLAAGAALALAGALAGAAAAFALARGLGREAVERFAGGRLARADAALGRHGLAAVLAARLVPVVPFTAINYAAGLSSVPVPAYAVGTALGIVPGTVVYAAVGAYGTTPGSWPFLAALGALVVLSLAGAALAARTRRSRAPGAAVAAPAGPEAAS